MTAFLSETTHRMILRYHPTIGHLFVPNQRARLTNEKGGYTVVTNSVGFRSDWEFPVARGSRPRILAFGDSTMAGDNGPNEIRYSDVLGDMLDAEVFNFGLPGSGTDQHLLVYREFARGIEADLILLAVQLDAVRRVQASSRESIDRATGRHIAASKPYFTLEGGDLKLHNVPVPMARPLASGDNGEGRQQRGTLRARLWSLAKASRLERMRTLVRARAPRIESEVYRLAGFQPYTDFASADTQGWRLLEAIIHAFVREAAPVPVLIVPVPTTEFFRHGARPVYLPLFERFQDAHRGVHIADISTPLAGLPWKARFDLTYRHDLHFSAVGNRKIAELLAAEIERRSLLPRRAKTNGHAAPPPHVARRRRVTNDARHILGISCFYHNSAACLIRDGRIVAAAEEERFTRVKNDRRFPRLAANACLEQGGIEPPDLAAVVFYDNASRTFERLLHSHIERVETAEDNWSRFVPSWLRYKLLWPQVFREELGYQGLLLQGDHHRSHAASAFFPSPFERAAILTVDGVGEWATASVGSACGHELKLLEEMRFSNSLGLLYSAFTQFTGFKVNSGEYKMMGLASYGEPRYVQTILDHLVDLKADGSLSLNLDYFGFLDRPSMVNDRFCTLFGGPGRRPEDRITRREIDLARSIQVVTEEAVLRMARHAHELTGEKNLCMAGGVALNCVANGRLLREGPFERLWIQPASGDAGGAVGAALDAHHTYFGSKRPSPEGRSQQGASYLGPSFSEDEIRSFLDTYGARYSKLSAGDRADTVARLLEEGKAVGHFADRMEFGPRALGARSILGDARNSEMQATLNLKIKYRESFRPFAPSVLRERVSDYFEMDADSPYMLLVAPVQPSRRRPRMLVEGDDLLPIVREVRSDLPAITHVDYSARIQTVARSDAPLYYDVIKAFERRTGTAVIVNTSFNVRGEPIVCTPYDAYRCFMRTEMDALMMGDFLLTKQEQPEWHEPKEVVGNDDVEASPQRPELDPDSERLAKVARLIYRRKLAPMALALRASRAAGVRDPQDATSAWHPYSAPTDPRRLFTVPLALDRPNASPRVVADAISQTWSPGAARETLKSIVADLLKARPRAHKEQTEEVSNSVYVMF